MRIGIDIDHTLTIPTHRWFEYFQSAECVDPNGPHRPYVPGEVCDTYDYFERWCNPCFAACLYHPEVIGRHELRGGAKDVLYKLRGEGHDLHVITARVEEFAPLTDAWLAEVGLSDLFTSVQCSHDKRAVCERLRMDVLFDDSPHVAAQFMAPPRPECQLVLFDAPHNREINGFPRVREWGAVPALIADVVPVGVDA